VHARFKHIDMPIRAYCIVLVEKDNFLRLLVNLLVPLQVLNRIESRNHEPFKTA